MLKAYTFPDPRKAPDDEPLAFGGDLCPERLLTAYSLGIFPWYEQGQPILWWCPNPRFTLPPKDCTINRGLRRALKKPHWHVTFDQAFADVMRACAQTPRKGETGTWITQAMLEAYCELHRLGYAHSVECWKDGELTGGLYGISLGTVFFGESMFHRESDASKVAFARLVERLIEWDFTLIDCQMPTEHLASFGAKDMPREAFLKHLKAAQKHPTRLGNWG